ncbi:hypothetical protein SHELI_v1c02190 [Spiroplasma helicoides]|uniref:DUF3137 domain-containing protein n=1 Tax=Spiroplasma helicoides TaxID=216938 RepID=A0A1B3SJR7_9MOLU|nr:hypothetical protein [Spiroplasma helicoides]AOG60174.1 hypothetical protein SHELI_v1c02190 [Spiroplasma helicoides]
MGAKQFLEEKALNLIVSNPVILKCIRKTKKLWKRFFIMLIISLTYSILCAFTIIIFGFRIYSFKINLDPSSVNLINIVLSTVLFALDITFIILAIAFKMQINGNGYKTRIIDELYKDFGLQKVYGQFFSKYIQNEDLKNFSINVISQISRDEDYGTTFKDFFNSKPIAINENEDNSFKFTYKGKSLLFFAKVPKKFTHYETIFLDTKGGRVTRKVVDYVSNAIVYLENDKYGPEFNGIKVRPYGANNKDAYQTESVDFNKKFSINVRNSDLRGPKFLSPKFIDHLNNIDVTNINVIGVNRDIYADWFYHDSFDCYYEVCSMELAKFDSVEALQKEIVDKVGSDFYLFEHLFECIKTLY